MEHLLDLFKFFPEAFAGQSSPQIVECLNGGNTRIFWETKSRDRKFQELHFFLEFEYRYQTQTANVVKTGLYHAKHYISPSLSFQNKGRRKGARVSPHAWYQLV